MERYTVEQRVYIVKTFYVNSLKNCSVKNTFRKIRDFFGPMLTSKIVASGTVKIQEKSKNCQCIRNVSLFGAVYGLEA